MYTLNKFKILILIIVMIIIVVICTVKINNQKYKRTENNYINTNSDSLKKEENYIFKSVKEHQSELNRIIDTVYNKYDNLSISYPENAEKDLRPFLLSINVRYLYIYIDEYGNKILELNIATDGCYKESIFYCNHETEELDKCYKKIISNWYYMLILYT